MRIKYGNVQKLLGTGSTLCICLTSCVHEEKEINEDEDDDDQHISHPEENVHFTVGNSQVIYFMAYSDFSRG